MIALSSLPDAAVIGYLPVVREYLHRMGVVDLVNQALDCRMTVDPGTLVSAMVMNVLMGRSPLYRVEEFFRSRDTGLLLGNVVAAQLNDDALGRLRDRIWEYGTWRLFSAISLEAYRRFEVDCSVINHDTTSVSVWGDYDHSHPGAVTITNGHSKDNRPDLKQFVLSLLCAEGNLPISATVRDGNANDKTINTAVVSTLPRLMARHGVRKKNFTLIVDAALVTQTNLTVLGKSGRFVTRLPATYACCGEAIEEAVVRDAWTEIGQIGCQSLSHTRKKARYRLQEGQVELYGQSYRAVIVHSDVHDTRRQRKLARHLDQERRELEKRIKGVLCGEFYCLPDAHQAVAALLRGRYHTLDWSIHQRPVFHRGRPPKDGSRQPRGFRFQIEIDLKPDQAAIQRLKEVAGCFVLLTSIPLTEASGLEILQLYKSQDGIERNFSFLKDPLVMNDLFIKKTQRVEALGFILVLSLLVWRLMERTMRQSVKQDGLVVPGWEDRPTTRPTSFMMASKFSSLLAVKRANKRVLTQPLQEQQLKYLRILDVHPDLLTTITSGHHY